jgi:heptosyltransferase-2
VGDALATEGLQIAIVAGPDDAEVAAAVQGAMRAPTTMLSDLPLRQLAAVLRRARLFVGNDSGVMHMAAAVGTPVVAVFGLSNHRAWGPYPPSEHEVVRLDLPCSPCLYRGLLLGDREGCPPRTCLTDLEPALVVKAARRLLARPHPSAASGIGVARASD